MQERSIQQPIDQKPLINKDRLVPVATGGALAGAALGTWIDGPIGAMVGLSVGAAVAETLDIGVSRVISRRNRTKKKLDK